MFVPAGRGDRWIYGVEQDLADETGGEFTEEGSPRRIRLGSGLPGLQPRIARIGTFTFAARLAERFRDGAGVPRRRRRAPDHPTRRHRHEHRHPERPRPGLEARLGAARLGRSRSCWTPTRPSAGRWPRTTWPARPTRTAAPGLRAGAPRRPRRPDPARLDAVAGRGASTLDLLGPGLTLFTTGPAGPGHRAATPVPGPPLVVHEVDADHRPAGWASPAAARCWSARTGRRADGGRPAPTPEVALREAVRAVAGKPLSRHQMA